MNSQYLGRSKTCHLLSTVGMTPEGSPALFRDPQSPRNSPDMPLPSPQRLLHPLGNSPICFPSFSIPSGSPHSLWDSHRHILLSAQRPGAPTASDSQKWLLCTLRDSKTHHSPSQGPLTMAVTLSGTAAPPPPIPSGTLHPLRVPRQRNSSPQGLPHPLRDPNSGHSRR